MKLRVFLAPVALAICVAGCASPEIPYDHGTAGIQKLGVLTPGFPTAPSVVLASDPGQSLALVGALVDIGLAADRDHQLKSIMANQQVDAFNDFWTDLVSSLQRDGYAVTAIPSNQFRSDFIKQFGGGTTPVDAYLDVVVKGYGYMAAGIGDSNPYRPFMLLDCKLVRVADSSVLMQDEIAVNPLNPQGGWLAPKQITISPDPDYAFPGMSDMRAAPPKVAAGVKSAFSQSTAEIGTLLK